MHLNADSATATLAPLTALECDVGEKVTSFVVDGKPVQVCDSIKAILDYLDRDGLEALHTSTRIIIAPGYVYKIVKMLVTNFHQPKSTLLLLVSAFLKGDWRVVYDYALSHGFRFLSYGDANLLIP